MSSDRIIGKLSTQTKLNGSLTPEAIMNGNLSAIVSITGKLTIADTFIVNYDGPYEVIPQKDIDQVLETSGKRMLKDVTVSEIPYWKTSNPQGGKTVYIGVS